MFGFRLSKLRKLRVPIVIFENLSRQDEARLFIDINTKQKPVPNELLLDIKKLARYESSEDEYIRELFDRLNLDIDSCLKGLMSPASKSKNKISRVTFNKAVKTFVSKIIDENEPERIYPILNQYLKVNTTRLDEISGQRNVITKSVIFTAVMSNFLDITSKVRDKFNENYSYDNFMEVMNPMFSKIKPSVLKNPGNSYKNLASNFLDYLNDQPIKF